MPKDFAESWEQRRWQHASESHMRWKKIVATYKPNDAFPPAWYINACKRIEDLEAQYPSLREKQHAQ